MNILCLFGRHRRSRGQAHYDGSRMVSKCRDCGCPMERQPSGRWIVQDEKANGPAPAEV